MKTFKKFLLIALFFTIINSLYAQQKDFNWRLGANYGYSNYYGDLTPYRFDNIIDWEAIRHTLDYNPNKNLGASYQIILERRVSNTVGFYMRYAFYDFSMNDRFTDKGGNIWTDAPNFDRGLNFRNQSRDYGFGFSLKTDNDRFLSSTSFIAPYLNFGVGMLDFKVFGDLLDDSGNFYDFSEANLTQNRQFETSLHSLETEGNFDQRTFYANMGLGVRFRLSSRVELFLQTDILRTFTNHLDDVAGKYRSSFDNELQAHASNPTGLPINPETDYRGNRDNKVDWIINHGAGVRFNFGFNRKSFVAAPVIPLKSFVSVPSLSSDVETPTEIIDSHLEPTYVRIEDYEEDKEKLTIKHAQIQVLDRQILAEQKRIHTIDSAQIAQKSLLVVFQDQNEKLRSILVSNNLSTEDFDREISAQSKKTHHSLDSLQFLKNRSFFKIDSLVAEKSNIYQNILPSKGYFLNTIKLNDVSSSEKSVDLKTKEEKPISTNENIRVKDKNALAIDSSAQNFSKSKTKVDEEKARTNPFDSIATNSTNEESNSSLETFYLSEIQRLRQENTSLRQETSTNSNSKRNNRNQAVIVNNRDRQPQRNDRQDLEEERKETRRANRNSFFGGLFAGAATSAVISSSDREQDSNSGSSLAAIDSDTSASFAPIVQFNHEESIPSSLAWKRSEIPIVDWTTIGVALPQAEDTKTPSTTRDTSFIEDRRATIKLIPSKQQILFDINQSIPTEEELKKLMPLVEFIQENSNYQLNISGFADNTGSLAYNLKLANQRMNSVGEILIESFGLQESQINYSEGGKIVRGNSQRSNSKDRRVEVSIIEK